MYHFVFNMTCGGIFSQKCSIFSKKSFEFILLQFIFSSFYCSKDIKRQTETFRVSPSYERSCMVLNSNAEVQNINALSEIFYPEPLQRPECFSDSP